MEKQIALVSKANKRVLNVLIVDNLDKDYIAQFATDECDVVAVKDTTPHINGLWDGKEFTPPDNKYLKEIGLIGNKNAAQAEAELQAIAKAALLSKLGITAEEAVLLLS